MLKAVVALQALTIVVLAGMILDLRSNVIHSQTALFNTKDEVEGMAKNMERLSFLPASTPDTQEHQKLEEEIKTAIAIFCGGPR